MGNYAAGLAFVVLIGCGPAATPTQSPATQRDATDYLARTEAAMVAAPTVRIESRITATGAVAADLGVVVDMAQGNKLRFDVRGTFNGNKVQGVYVSNGTTDSQGDATPVELNRAVVVGWLRMGLLHNVAVLLGGRAPDHSAGGAADWVRANDVVFAPPRVSPAANERAVAFGISVAGKPSGRAEMTIEDGSLRPTGRTQRVDFPGGTMEVKESYQVVLGKPSGRYAFTAASDCKAQEECLIQVCALGDQRGCETFASHLIYGAGVTKDVERGLNLSRRACAMGRAPSCVVGAYHLRHLYKKRHYTEARRMQHRAKALWGTECGMGNQASCAAAKSRGGSMRRLTGPTAVRHFGIGCDAGDAPACVDLARVHKDGLGVPVNRDLARARLAPWCPKSGDACYVLGRMSAGDEAADLFTMACAQGHQNGCVEAIRTLDRLPARAGELATLRAMACDKGWAPDTYCVEAAAALPPREDARAGLLEKGCSSGGTKSCMELVKLYTTKNDKNSPRLIAEAHRRSCKHGRKAPLCASFIAAARKAGLMKNRGNKLRLHTLACTEGRLMDSCRRAAKLSAGKPGPFHLALCDEGDAVSCYWAGTRVAGASLSPNGVVDNASHDAKQLFKKGCTLGDHVSCHRLGDLRKACDDGKGSYDGCLALARRSTNVDGKDGTVTGARDDACRLACRAWGKRNRRDKRASGKNPRLDRVCRKVKRCR